MLVASIMLVLYILELLIVGRLCSASESCESVSEKLRDLESTLVEQGRVLMEQQKMLAEQERRLVEQDNRFFEQEHRLNEQENRLKEQEHKITELEKMNTDQQQVNEQQQRSIDLQQRYISQLEATLNKHGEEVAVVNDYMSNQDLPRSGNFNSSSHPTVEQLASTRNDKHSFEVRQLPERVAFTAFLDHSVSNLGIDQTIVYNRVLLNEGSAYHPSSGIFTCPVSGLYVFYFSISSLNIDTAVVKLNVDGVNQVDAIAKTQHVGGDNMGANLAVLSLSQGQRVWVANYYSSHQFIRGEENYRYSTFSGFLLY